MTRKDFELIARTIRELPLSAVSRRKVAVAFADELRSTNSNFDRDRFIKATELTG